MIDVDLNGKELLLDVTEEINGVLNIGLDMGGGGPAQTIVHINTTEYWNNKESFVGQKGHIYVYSDHGMVNGQYIPAVKIGDGLSFLIDNPFVSSNQEQLLNHINDNAVHITQEERYFWNNKVRCDDTTISGENIAFTKN